MEKRIADATPQHAGSKFLPMYVRQGYHLALLGHTDKELAIAFEVTHQQINKWKQRNEAFARALKRGRDEADGRIAERLFRRAMGWSQPDTKFFYDSKRGKVVSKRYIAKFPPDVTAMIFWLKNRQSEKWRDRAFDAFMKSDPTTLAGEIRAALKQINAADGTGGVDEKERS